mmetsp:Transcript_73444/g.238892  ORF Transcript_73444/g.238892 Transcript_73444/m.238892 type:complete len:288 (-) Transcript_73444:203-1066(-)
MAAASSEGSCAPDKIAMPMAINATGLGSPSAFSASAFSRAPSLFASSLPNLSMAANLAVCWARGSFSSAFTPAASNPSDPAAAAVPPSPAPAAAALARLARRLVASVASGDQLALGSWANTLATLGSHCSSAASTLRRADSIATASLPRLNLMMMACLASLGVAPASASEMTHNAATTVDCESERSAAFNRSSSTTAGDFNSNASADKRLSRRHERARARRHSTASTRTSAAPTRTSSSTASVLCTNVSTILLDLPQARIASWCSRPKISKILASGSRNAQAMHPRF